MNEIKFTIYGDPKIKRRHRDRIIHPRGGGKPFTMHYPDPKTAEEEKHIAVVAAENRPEQLIETGVILSIKYFFSIPKSYSKKKRERIISGELQYTKKPDLTNMTKAIEDACNKVIWVDDSQVFGQIVFKYYGKVPRTEVKIEWF